MAKSFKNKTVFGSPLPYSIYDAETVKQVACRNEGVAVCVVYLPLSCSTSCTTGCLASGDLVLKL
jgi:hypothetical protein